MWMLFDVDFESSELYTKLTVASLHSTTMNKGYFTSEATFRYDIVYIYKSKNCLDHLLQVNTTLLGDYYPPPLLGV